jgi:hypothetical protein
VEDPPWLLVLGELKLDILALKKEGDGGAAVVFAEIAA